MKFIFLIFILLIIWFVPIVKHVHEVNCIIPPCPNQVYIETIKQYVSEEIKILDYKLNFN